MIPAALQMELFKSNLSNAFNIISLGVFESQSGGLVLLALVRKFSS